MSETQSRWQTRELAKIYSEGVRGAIPGAGLQLEVLDALVLAWRPEPAKILDLGCGDGVLGRMFLNEYPGARVVFGDFSEPMLEKVRVAVGENGRARAVQVDFSAPSWVEAVSSEAPFDIVVSGFAIHHQPDERKRALYGEIRGLLADGGLFLNLDQVKSATPCIEGIFDCFFLDAMARFLTKAGMPEKMEEIDKAYYGDKKENKPAPVEVQCQWLRELGFEQVDCFFKTFELALFGGRKALEV